MACLSALKGTVCRIRGFHVEIFVADAKIPEAALDSAILQNAYESTVFKVTAHTRFQV